MQLKSELLVLLTYSFITPVNVMSFTASFCVTIYYFLQIRKEYVNSGLNLKDFLFKYKRK